MQVLHAGTELERPQLDEPPLPPIAGGAVHGIAVVETQSPATGGRSFEQPNKANGKSRSKRCRSGMISGDLRGLRRGSRRESLRDNRRVRERRNSLDDKIQGDPNPNRARRRDHPNTRVATTHR